MSPWTQSLAHLQARLQKLKARFKDSRAAHQHRLSELSIAAKALDEELLGADSQKQPEQVLDLCRHKLIVIDHLRRLELAARCQQFVQESAELEDFKVRHRFEPESLLRLSATCGTATGF